MYEEHIRYTCVIECLRCSQSMRLTIKEIIGSSTCMICARLNNRLIIIDLWKIADCPQRGGTYSRRNASF